MIFFDLIEATMSFQHHLHLISLGLSFFSVKEVTQPVKDRDLQESFGFNTAIQHISTMIPMWPFPFWCKVTLKHTQT